MHWNLLHFYSTFTITLLQTKHIYMEHAKSLTLYKHNYKHSCSIFNNFHLTMMLWHIETLYLFNKLYSKTPMQLCIDCQWESGLSLQILFLIFFVPLSGSAPGVQLKNLLIHLDVIWSYSSQCLYIKCVEVLDCNASVIVVTSRSAIHKDFLLLCIKCKLAYWINSPKEISQDASGRERRLLLLNFLFKWDFIFVWPSTTTSPECTDFQNKELKLCILFSNLSL